MTSPAVEAASVSTLFTVGLPSTSGQVEAGIVAGLYFIPSLGLLLQFAACRGKYHAVSSTCLFAAARGVGYVFRVLAEEKVTKSNFEAYLILSSAATFLLIGALGDLLTHWFEHSSGKGHLGFIVRHGGYQRHVKFTAVNALLTALGVVFAVIGIKAALDLFSASTYAELDSAQKTRTISNKGFLALMAIYTAFAFGCNIWSWVKGPNADARSPSRMLVISVLSVACVFLLVRTVFGLLAIDHHQFSNNPKLLYTLEVLPEMIALYIVAIPGFIPAVGRDAESHAGIMPTCSSSEKAQPEDQLMSHQDDSSHDHQHHTNHAHMTQGHVEQSHMPNDDQQLEKQYDGPLDPGSLSNSHTAEAATALSAGQHPGAAAASGPELL